MKTLILPFLIAFLLASTVHAAKLQGVFDAGWTTSYQDSAYVDSLYGRLADMGMHTVVVQFAISQPSHRYYPSQLSWANNSADFSRLFSMSLAAAEHHGLQVYLGLYYEESGWWTTVDSLTLERLRERNLQVVQELSELYGSYASWKGFYLPQEIARYYWSTDADRNRLVRQFLEPVAIAAHQVNKTLMASPFYNQDLESAQEWGAFMDSLLAHWSVDVIAVQDGIGAGHIGFDNLGDYLRATQQACMRHGTAFGVDAELFLSEAQIGPAPLSRIAQQLDTAAAAGATVILGYDLATIQGSFLDSLAIWQLEPSRVKPARGILSPQKSIRWRFDLLGRYQ